jgi:5'-deoxynucleotidase YfbR-like HD superfamily hydrolase
MIQHSIIKTIRAGNSVTRWHTRRMHRYETVGEHTANVIAIIMAMSGMSISSPLLHAALIHDTAEQWTGDIPATAKWESEFLKKASDELEHRKLKAHHINHPELTGDEYLILKWADMLDLLYTCLGELQMGNRTISEVFERGVLYLRGLTPHQAGLELLDELITERLALDARR